MNSKSYDAHALTEIRKDSTTHSSKDHNSARSDFPLDSPSSLAEKLFRLAVLLLALLCVAARPARACGPDFPNHLLESGEAALLTAPIARFRDELIRMHLATSRFAAKPATNGYAAQSLEAEIADLGAALRQADVPADTAGRICAAHRVEREKLRAFVASFDDWADSGEFVWDDSGGHRVPPPQRRPKFAGLAPVPGVPAEFADYLEGAAAWHDPSDPKKAAARAAWERLLARPASERKFKSTWAAYMLGKYWEDDDKDKAARYFKQVRELVRAGFADSTGLAAASLGWEARLNFQQNKFRRAISLYLEQLAAGDDSALVSLQWAATAALASPEALPELARDDQAQKVITAALIAGEATASLNHDDTESGGSVSANWLAAVEAAGVNDVESAEKLALAAYQAGEFDAAERWLKRAKDAPVAQWVQAKLLLRAGKLREGGTLLAKVAGRLPVIVAPGTARPIQLADNLYSPFINNRTDHAVAAEQVLAELGVLRLQRGEFVSALDALLRADFWGDAAYVAERVLTVDELKSYVDQSWPWRPTSTLRSGTNTVEAAPTKPAQQSENIRYLLARRLTRELRGNEARAYYPEQWQSPFDELVAALVSGWNEARPAAERAGELFRAAWRVRTNGMELLGTELAPDHHQWGGDFQDGITWQARAATAGEARLNVATTNELRRAAAHGADPERRFHYRYQAAFLAARAASWLPDNSDYAALMLCTAGYWLKDRDPKTADLFYKTLVRRCRKTALGAAAERLRWFPALDMNGQFTPPPLPPIEQVTFTLEEDMPAEEAEDDSDTARPAPQQFSGLRYSVEPGDTVSALVRAMRRNGVPISVADVLRANPDLEPTNMPVGFPLVIPLSPLPAMEAESEPE